MKILIGSQDIAGLITQYKAGFIDNGHNVTTIVNTKHNFYNYEYDYVTNDMFFSSLYSVEINKKNYLKRLIRKINYYNRYYEYKKFIRQQILEHDIIILIWHPFFSDCSDLKFAKKYNKKIISIFVGSDVRYFQAFKQEFNVINWKFPDNLDHTNPNYHLKIIRNSEKYSDLIYSVPDQAGLQLRPYSHSQVPIEVEHIQFNYPDNQIPKVIHAPSEPFKKGTDIIDSTLRKLKLEGLKFEYISVRNLKNREILKLLKEADILVDEIVFNGPGVLSFEAMASGCAVATKYIESSPNSFQPPIWNIDASNIYEKLKKLLTDFELRKKLAFSGREYVENNNSAKIITKKIIEDLDKNVHLEYYPAFLLKVFIPQKNSERLLINKWNKFVNKCVWYKENIKPFEREGLKF